MSGPVRVQLRRNKGWGMPPNTVSVARPGRWGKFYRVGQAMCDATIKRWGHQLGDFSRRDHVCDSAEEAVRRFRAVVAFDEAIHPKLRADLTGKNLACWCPVDRPCHADVLLELANLGQ